MTKTFQLLIFLSYFAASEKKNQKNSKGMELPHVSHRNFLFSIDTGSGSLTSVISIIK